MIGHKVKTSINIIIYFYILMQFSFQGFTEILVCEDHIKCCSQWGEEVEPDLH